VAVSWALPNGIPDTPGENRMAVHTEDHPLEYLDFEGEIPKGQYGAGTMSVWDRGTYDCLKWEDRKVEVNLHGERVQGRYALFQFGDDPKNWMIHRMDPPADPDREPLPEHVVPMTAVPGELPDGPGWGFEVAWGGERVIAFLEPGRIRMENALLDDVTDLFPEVRRLTREVGARPMVLDGEMIVFGDDGRPAADRLKRRLKPGTDSAIRTRARANPVVYVIYDLLHLDHRSTMPLAYAERRERLEELGLDGEAWRTPAYHRGDGRELLEAARAQGLPGIVAKRLADPYEPGRPGWILVRAEPETGRPPAGAEGAANGRPPITHADRVIYPKVGFTKKDVADYYLAVAHVLLPHLHGRPVSMRRYFQGVEGPHRWEKECPPQAPDWLTRVAVPSEAKGRPINYCVIDSVDALMWSVNHANLELHVTLALGSDIQRPTAMVFDLDPGEGTGIEECADVGLLLRGLFEQLKLESFAKTTGSKGLQVYIPLNSDVTYEQTKPFARQVAETLEARYPDRITSNMAKAKRSGKVLVDWSQNDWHKSTVCAYSLRARERPTVSTPVTWEEVEAYELDYDQADVRKRVAEHGDLFAPVLSTVQELPRAR
jgi:bifunctional non-homologous end joining protein LigD